MSTYDQTMMDNLYTGGFDTNNYLFSQQPTTQQDLPNIAQDENGLYGGRGYLEPSAYGNKQDDEIYRYVSSRLTDRSSPPIAKIAPGRSGATTRGPYDIESNNIGANNTQSHIPYGQASKPVSSSQRQPSNTLTNMPKIDARQDSLLGPLLAELDSMSNQPQQMPPSHAASIHSRSSISNQPQQVPPSHAPSIHSRSSMSNQPQQLPPSHAASIHSRSSISNQQQQVPPSHAPSIHSQKSMSYQSNPVRPIGSSQPSSHALSSTTNRTVADALRDAGLYDSLDPNDQQPSYPLDMNGTDLFMPPSNTAGPGSYYNQYDPVNQIYPNPVYDTSGQNSSPNQRPTPQNNPAFDKTHSRSSSLAPPAFIQQNTNPFIDHQSLQAQEPNAYKTQPPNNQEMFFTDHNNDQLQQLPMVTQRDKPQQAKQRTNVKKHEPRVRGKGTIGSSITSNSYSDKQSSDHSKSPRRPLNQQPSRSKSNHIEKNIDMIKNKENYYHRYPPRKYEDSYSKRKDFQSGNEQYDHESEPETSNTRPRQASLPLTINLNTSDNSLNRTLPATVTIPLDNHINHGETISVDINLRLIDPENRGQQQHRTFDHPNWSGADALERHIRKMERNIDQALPETNPPQRNPIMPSTSANLSGGRYGKSNTITGYSGSNSSNYGKDSYNYSNKGREENSYLAQMNYPKKYADFKPYTTRDYERFKKNYGFGTSHLGFDSENTSFKEKMERAVKVKEYAQHIEERNRKILSDTNNRSLSGTRSPTDEAKTLKLFGQTQLPKRTIQFSDKSAHSSPISMTEIVPFVPARRPTDVLYRTATAHRPTEIVHRVPPARRQTESVSQGPSTRRPTEFLSQASPPAQRRTRLQQYENFEPVERSSRHHERDDTSAKRTVNPPIKRREQMDENDTRHFSRIESPPQNRMALRRLSPVKLSSPPGQINSGNMSKRRPIRFDKLLLPDEPTDSLPEQHYPIQQQQLHKRKLSDDLVKNPQNSEESLMKAIHEELRERPLKDDEELVVVE